MEKKTPQRKPDWLRIKIQTGEKQQQVMELMQSLSLHTVCGEANCPNLMECFGRGTAAFMILGRYCTRNCTFCCVEKNVPLPPDEEEPAHVAHAVRQLGLKHVVVTSVTRDDLPDGGAAHFARTIEEIRRQDPQVVIEVLIPDFKGDPSALATVLAARPHILNHNVETVPRLYPEVRPMAVYERSIGLLASVKKSVPAMYTKSGFMLGLGETGAEVRALLADLRKAGCDFLTIGQYLAPSKKHHPVVEYVHPSIFAEYKEIALSLGFLYVSSGPLVRSSYQADKAAEYM